MDTSAYLISSTYTEDELSQKIRTTTKREIMCSVKSTSKSEFFEAGSFGLKSAMVIVTPYVNYEGEDLIEYNGEVYSIYRTYRVPDDEDIELYLEQRSGDNGIN